MKLSKIFVGMLASVALVGCSSDEPAMTDDASNNAENSRFMAVTITNGNPAGRAYGEAYEQGGNPYEDGTEAECKVASVDFYFFDAAGAPVMVNAAGNSNLVTSTNIELEGENHAETVEQILKAVIVLNTKNGDNIANIKSMLAVLNSTKKYANTSLTDLKKLVMTETAAEASTDNKFLMTNSSHVTGDYNIETEILPTHIKTSEDAALADPVEIYVERVVAKVRCYAAWDASKVTTTTATYEGKSYTAIQVKDKEGKAVKATVNGAEKDVYVILLGWGVTNTMDKSYLLKKIDNAWEAWDWNWKNGGHKFRTSWALNPEIPDTTRTYMTYTNMIKMPVGTADAKGSAQYCFENAGQDATDGTKPLYNPDYQLSNRTQVAVGAVLVTIEGTTATQLEYATWGGASYSLADVKKAMLAPLQTLIYKGEFKTEGGEETDAEGNVIRTWTANSYVYTSISEDDVDILPAWTAGVANGNSQNSKRYTAVLKFKGTWAANTWFKDKNAKTQEEAASHAYATEAELNAVIQSIPAARVYSDGKSYYYVDIEHLGTEATKGLFGVVRNHLYDIEITSLTGLGTPVLIPDGAEGTDKEEEIIPQKPGDDDSYLGARIHQYSWRVVKKSYSFNW